MLRNAKRFIYVTVGVHCECHCRQQLHGKIVITLHRYLHRDRVDDINIMSNAKISIRFFDDREVRAVWDEQNSKWWFSVLDIVAVLTDQDDYTKTRNYWKYLKAKLKKEKSQVVSATTQLKILAPDGKKRLADMLDYNGIIDLGKQFPSKKANRFIEWFTFSDESIDGKSKTKAYSMFESSFINFSLTSFCSSFA